MPKNEFPPIDYPLVAVLWHDSTGHGRWISKEELADDRETLCMSIGWRIFDEPDKITLAPHIAFIEGRNDFGDVSGVITIPRSAIERTLVLKQKGRSLSR